MYAVKEVFKTLQGEGRNAGRVAVFCRFTGCNLWSGYEKDRPRAICTFCDTDFVGTDGSQGGKYTAKELAGVIEKEWALTGIDSGRLVVFTGGEPLLQLDEALLSAVRARGFETCVETNGTIQAPRGIDWLCVSPKAGAELVQRTGDELKLVYPQAGVSPEDYERMEFKYFYLQPMHSASAAENTHRAIQYCEAHPKWRLSVQVHKVLGIR